MDPQTLAAVLDPEVYRLLDELEYSRAGELALAERLRRQGLSAEAATAVLAQAELRQEAEAKFGPFAADMLFTRPGLEQATRLPVAAHHAARMTAAGAQVIADLGCGIGADALAFAGLGASVEAVDADEVTAAIAAFNLRHLDTVTVSHARAEDYDLSRADALWLDPARRDTASGKASGASRLSDPEAFSPSLSWAFKAAAEVAGAGIKLGPALDHGLVPDGWEAQWVSHDGDVVEVALYHGAVCQRPGRSALVMRDGGTLAVHESEVPADDEEGIGELGAYLFEPDGAIVRAGLVRALCAPLDVRRISAPIAYLTGDALPDGAAARAVRAWRIADVLPAGIKPLRRALIERGISRVVIKKRGADIAPDQVRRQLKLPKGGQSATLFFTRIGEQHAVLLADDVELGSAAEP
ncbi:class I SAM-dependent methyltransferase [Brevibacterium luteolum]|uniref:Class I SAM-dependent methyltransferase n=1 Tax=Brevibacterium luteolum TaxID=199591 RepID=A0A849B3D7_9MICO|nr:class I SAM-dependent methyltransferase [Brevibacterium luteolum]MBM7529330.1 hypothetical protein [Brevibacterium luteolum]NNG79756.1 class I SAM-dependent methyltransferase [Brevibacterium luteolum]